MEKKKVQRIIGILVIVAIIIILIPFLFGKKEEETTTQEATPLTAPVSSDQQTPTESPAAANSTTDSQSSNTQSSAASPTDINTSSAQDNGITPITQTPDSPQNTAANPADIINNSPAQSDSTVQNTNALSPANSSDTANNNQQPSTTLDSHPNVKYTGNTVEVTPAQTKTNDATAQNTQVITPAIAATINNAVQPETKAESKSSNIIPAARTHKSIIAKKAHRLSEKQLANFKKPAWVVQMGSFKDKSNAHHLVDRLRAAGFKAFTHEVASAGNSRTRVYIGPEFKEASAHKLSNKIEQTTKLRGYVVPFKPMAL